MKIQDIYDVGWCVVVDDGGGAGCLFSFFSFSFHFIRYVIFRLVRGGG